MTTEGITPGEGWEPYTLGPQEVIAEWRRHPRPGLRLSVWIVENRKHPDGLAGWDAYAGDDDEQWLAGHSTGDAAANGVRAAVEAAEALARTQG